MGTEISRRLLAALILGLACAACGATTTTAPRGRGSGSAGSGAGGSGASRSGGAFSWFAARPAPTAWRTVRIPSGAAMAYPPRWSVHHGDVGTATVALLGPHGDFVGYLNLTPREGAETLAHWASFRIHHNGDEGDRHVRQLAASGTLRFRTGSGRCVTDSYVTRIGDHFIELACLIAGSRTSSVIVAAAPPSAWHRESGVLERAVEAVET